MPEASRLSWIPNAITLSRFVVAFILLCGAALLTFSPSEPNAAPAPFGLFMVFCYLFGALSDLIDGWAARALHAESELGARLDPMADKALGFGALTLVCAASSFTPIVVAAASLIILRDWWIDQLRTKRSNAPGLKVTGLAKFKTALLFIALGFLLSGLQPWPEILGNLTGGHWTYPVGGFLPGVALLWCATVLALLTGWQYIRAARLTSGGV